VFLDLQARAALRGYQVDREIDANTRVVRFVIRRWNRQVHFESLHDLTTWLNRAGVQV
jgi:hypothetical protein